MIVDALKSSHDVYRASEPQGHRRRRRRRPYEADLAVSDRRITAIGEISPGFEIELDGRSASLRAQGLSVDATALEDAQGRVRSPPARRGMARPYCSPRILLADDSKHAARPQLGVVDEPGSSGESLLGLALPTASMRSARTRSTRRWAARCARCSACATRGPAAPIGGRDGIGTARSPSNRGLHASRSSSGSSIAASPSSAAARRCAPKKLEA